MKLKKYILATKFKGEQKMSGETVRRTKKQRKITGKIKEEDFASSLSDIQKIL